MFLDADVKTANCTYTCNIKTM